MHQRERARHPRVFEIRIEPGELLPREQPLVHHRAGRQARDVAASPLLAHEVVTLRAFVRHPVDPASDHVQLPFEAILV